MSKATYIFIGIQGLTVNLSNFFNHSICEHNAREIVSPPRYAYICEVYGPVNEDTKKLPHLAIEKQVTEVN